MADTAPKPNTDFYSRDQIETALRSILRNIKIAEQQKMSKANLLANVEQAITTLIDKV